VWMAVIELLTPAPRREIVVQGRKLRVRHLSQKTDSIGEVIGLMIPKEGGKEGREERGEIGKRVDLQMLYHQRGEAIGAKKRRARARFFIVATKAV